MSTRIGLHYFTSNFSSTWLPRNVRKQSTVFKRTLKGVNRMGQPLMAIWRDYVEVAKDLVMDARQRPVKTLIYLLFGGVIVATWKKRPDYASYMKETLEYSNELALCSEAVRNPRAKLYVDNIIMMDADGYLQYMNFGLFALVLRKSFSPNCANYHETCGYLQPRVWSVGERIVDVGVWGRWLQLEKEMVDFDVNEDE